MTTIYALTEGDNDQDIRYIGKTIRDIKHRYREHVKNYNKYQTQVSCWLKNRIEVKKTVPKLIILDIVADKDVDFWEYHYISLYRSWGFKLLNHALEPLGPKYASEEVKLKSTKNRKPKKYEDWKHLLDPNFIKNRIEKHKVSSNIKRTPVILTKGEERLEFKSITDAGKHLNVNPEHVRRVLYKKIKYNGSVYKTIKGYSVVPLI